MRTSAGAWASRLRNAHMSGSCEQLLRVGDLGVRFRFQKDRYAHEILLANGDKWTTVLASVEGSSADDWPASPPLQSLHVESRPGNGQVALLVGMAGHSHWSMSVELDPAAARITFDVACRTRGRPLGQLGSRYKALHPWAERGPRRAICTPTATAPVHVGLEICTPFGDARVEATADVIHLIAVPPASDQPRTVRWGYTVTRDNESCPS
jgi:hypothetical protein